MSNRWITLTGLLFIGAVGTSQAHPLDSPDVVYIDGQPCNSACQSYMAWSLRRTSSANQHAAPAEPPSMESPPTKAAATKPAMRPAKRAVSRAAAVQRESSKPSTAGNAKRAAPAARATTLQQPLAMPPPSISEPAPISVATSPSVAEPAPTNVAPLPPTSDPAPANVVISPAADSAPPAPEVRTVQEQVTAAAAFAEQITPADATPAPHREAAEASIFAETARPSDREPTASTTTDNRENRVAVLMARPEIESVSDLAGKDVAIEDQQSASRASIRAAIASAGAAEVQLDEKNTKAVDRLVGGEVPAAVVALVSPEAAAWFPELPGYRIFRITLSPGG